MAARSRPASVHMSRPPPAIETFTLSLHDALPIWFLAHAAQAHVPAVEVTVHQGRWHTVTDVFHHVPSGGQIVEPAQEPLEKGHVLGRQDGVIEMAPKRLARLAHASQLSCGYAILDAL